MKTSQRMPTYYLSHGGGPWPYMDGPVRDWFRGLEESLKDIPRQLSRLPSAILVVSGHWEEKELTLSSAEKPGMIHDFYGFPEHLYRISYPAPGSPELAAHVRNLLNASGRVAHLDSERGFDHGTYCALKPIYPAANVPVVQLSMKIGLDPIEHIEVGKALAPLRDEGVLIIGSGSSYHNLRERGKASAATSKAFDNWLRCSLLGVSPDERLARLSAWETAPSARAVHPREDHLIPLMVAVGAAEFDPASCVYGERVLGHLATSNFRFGQADSGKNFDFLGME